MAMFVATIDNYTTLNRLFGFPVCFFFFFFGGEGRGECLVLCSDIMAPKQGLEIYRADFHNILCNFRGTPWKNGGKNRGEGVRAPPQFLSLCSLETVVPHC